MVLLVGCDGLLHLRLLVVKKQLLSYVVQHYHPLHCRRVLDAVDPLHVVVAVVLLH